ncbi:MAG: sigma-70 factor domain-containing protein, partial [Thermoguttaceae bacterium]
MPKIIAKPTRIKKSDRTPADREPDEHLPPLDDPCPYILNADADAESDVDLEESRDMQATGEDDQIEDPIRIYLMQMGEIPLLSRGEELSAARQIKRTRRQFRYTLLSTDYALAAAIEMLRSIRDGRSRLDRTIEVSVINLR